ncbi:MAG: dATP/dGTP diphosphohydrolase domain-containing protein [Eubacteriales bacterium]
MKEDQGKPHPTFCPTQIIHDIIEVREFAMSKYSDPDNWKKVDNIRFIEAFLRHALAFWADPHSVDEESGLSHYKHMACGLAFICENLKTTKENENVSTKRCGLD